MSVNVKSFKKGLQIDFFLAAGAQESSVTPQGAVEILDTVIQVMGSQTFTFRGPPSETSTLKQHILI